MRLTLCSKADQPDHSLMHYRVGGEKKGRRRWQNKDGSYTPEGYQHYAEMYGWSKREKKQFQEADKQGQKAKAQGKTAAKLGLASIGTGAGTVMGLQALARGINERAVMAFVKASSVVSGMGSADDPQTWNNFLQNGMKKLEASRLLNSAHNMDVAADWLNVIGPAAVGALGLGAITVGGIAAYNKIRSSLIKKKLTSIEDDSAKDIRHADEDTMAFILDSLTDKQKLAVIVMLDQIAAGKVTVDENGKVTVRK